MLEHNQYPLCYTSGSFVGSNVADAVYLWTENGTPCYVGQTHQYIHDRCNGHLKGRVVSEETRRKLSMALNGRKHSEEHTKKVADSKRGKKRSDEVKLKMSLAHIGKKHSEETKKKMSASMRGIKRSAEACKNISEGKKLAYMKLKSEDSR